MGKRDKSSKKVLHNTMEMLLEGKKNANLAAQRENPLSLSLVWTTLEKGKHTVKLVLKP